ncbi:unnamed protein product [Aureobasidium mustum]|uniref:Uncharacterized protein n=1 Tax=Aureobasidium mustum TaxID=2773714 RepID=A0A9N8JU83_9PEZI|nr:unnamed protein product [Aureobasidium mustum]
MDEETAKEIRGLQDQLSSLLSRKRKRDNDALEDEVKHLKQRLTNSLKRCQDANAKSAQLSKKNKELEIENELLEKSTKDQAHSISRLSLEIDELSWSKRTTDSRPNWRDSRNKRLPRRMLSRL